MQTTYIRPPIVIVGSRRSGTSLLRNILSNHPKLIVHPGEPQFILQLYQRFGLKIEDTKGAFHLLCKHAQYGLDSKGSAALEKMILGRHSMTLQEVIHAYLAVFSSGRPEQTPVIKHPRLIFHLKLVYHLFPDAILFHVIRDPRGCVASQLSRWPQLSIWDAITWWKQAVRTGRQAASFNANWHEIRFHHLVSGPESTLLPILEPYGLGIKKGGLAYETDKARIAAWKMTLPGKDVQKIESCCSKEMAWWSDPAMYPARTNLVYGWHCLLAGLRFRARKFLGKL